MDKELFGDRREALEEECFQRREAALLAQRRTEEQRRTARAALAAASHITDDALLDQLVAFGINADTLTALSLVLLVEVAADGSDLESPVEPVEGCLQGIDPKRRRRSQPGPRPDRPAVFLPRSGGGPYSHQLHAEREQSGAAGETSNRRHSHHVRRPARFACINLAPHLGECRLQWKFPWTKDPRRAAANAIGLVYRERRPSATAPGRSRKDASAHADELVVSGRSSRMGMIAAVLSAFLLAAVAPALHRWSRAATGWALAVLPVIVARRQT